MEQISNINFNGLFGLCITDATEMCATVTFKRKSQTNCKLGQQIQL